MAAGDVTGDGAADLVAGSGVGAAPQARVFDGATGGVARALAPFGPLVRGGVRVAAAYVDGDQYADVVVGTGPGAAPRVRTLSGRTGDPVAGPAGDFDPGVGTWLGGVNIAAGNDPVTVGVTLTPSAYRLLPGQTVAVTIAATFSPAVTSSNYTIDWGDGSTDGAGYSYSPTAVGSDSRTFTHSYASAGTYTVAAEVEAFAGGKPPASGKQAATVDLAVVPVGSPAVDPAGPGNAPGTTSPAGVRYKDGMVRVAAADWSAGGFDGPAGHDRAWTNDPGAGAGGEFGTGWVAADRPAAVRSGSAVVLLGGAVPRYCDGQGSPDGNGNYATYAARFDDPGAVTYDGTNDELVLADGDGRVVRFFGFGTARPAGKRGTLKSDTAPGGTATEAVAWDALGRVTETQRAATVGGTTTTESVVTAYLGGSDPNAGRVSTVTLRRKVGAGAWATVRAATYDYYEPLDTGGSPGDLARVTVTDGTTLLDQWYYRYYTADTFSGGVQIGYAGGLKYALGPQAAALLKAAAGGTDAGVDGASDATVAGYADRAFEYDASHRVSKAVEAGTGCSVCTGGRGTFTYAYTASGNTPGANSWAVKTVETLADGNTNTVYTNDYAEVMLAAYSDTAASLTWRRFYRYDSAGRLVLDAAPSAVTGANDAYADLVHYVSGNAQYLADGAGLVTAYTYGSSTTATSSTAGDAAGYASALAVRQGETGTDVPQAAWTYFRKSAGGATVTPVAAETVYRNANGTGGQTTGYAYTWHSGTVQPEQVTTTLPTVTTGQNGPNAAVTVVEVYDLYGRPVWAKDGDGFLTYAAYDVATGAATRVIRDVNTATTADFTGLPSGWSTPGGGGLHLKVDYEVDALGRATKVTDANGQVTYTVFDDPGHAARTYRGWDATANLPTGPTEVVREDRAGGYTERLTMSATPAVSGGRPTGAEAIGSIQSLARSYRNAAGQTVSTDVYFSLSGLTYSTSTTLGTEGTHFDRTRLAYDSRGRANKTVTPAGTITRTVSDGLGRAVSVWVGTDDTPTTGNWSPTNLTGTNLVKVRDYEYDGGGVGDSSLTKVTDSPGLSGADRVTQIWSDWRGRAVAVKAGVEGSEGTGVNRPLVYTELDNLGQAVAVERFDADGVTPTTTSGVPNRPSSSLLRAKTVASFDELGRAYRTQVYGVDPSSGSVSTYALTTDLWFDNRGNVVKTAAPGGLVTKTAYDGAGRATTAYTADGGGDSGWSDALTVTGDTVLAQAEVTYDANGNVLLTTTRDRFHDASGTGALGTPSSGVAARVSYAAAYYDLADRLTASLDVGTNGGSSYTRPGSVPSRSDTVLVSSLVYDAAGRVWKTTGPRGIESRKEYDAAGRVVKSVENYVDGTVSDADDKTTEYVYGPAGLTSLTAKLTGGGSQVTQWVYGVTQAGGSGLDSNDIMGATRWPDPSTGAASSGQQDAVTVNALGQTATATDRNGSTHTLTYDALGRRTADAVTTLGSGVDGAVRRIETGYDGQGNVALVTSYDAASSGSIVNQVQRDFNGLGQLTSEWQSHSGAVGGGTPRVQYTYTEMAGGANHSRLTSMTYPNGRVVNYVYSSGLNATSAGCRR
ncbi:MAG: hypothetical protein U0871_09480 [Gemmataceae bacterium]